MTHAIDATGRHPATQQIVRWFDHDHLPEPMRTISAHSADLAEAMLRELPDSPELTTGLRRLLEAKDCFVRAAIDIAPGRDTDLASLTKLAQTGLTIDGAHHKQWALEQLARRLGLPVTGYEPGIAP